MEGDRFDRSKALLAKLGIPFEAEEQSLELGQPLASLEEARQFLPCTAGIKPLPFLPTLT